MILGELNEDGVPLEFIDPLVFEIMEDPVIIPPQGEKAEPKNVDRWVLYQTFEKAKAQIDPWTRNDLSNVAIMPNTELLERINKWKSKKKNKKLAKKYKLKKPTAAEIQSRQPTSIEIRFQNNLFDYIGDYIDEPPGSEQFEKLLNALISVLYHIEHLDLNRETLYSSLDSEFRSVKYYYKILITQSSTNLDSRIDNLINDFNLIRHNRIKHNLELV